MSTSTRGLRSMVRSRGGWLLLTGLVVPRAASTVSVFATSAVLGPDGRGVIAFVLGTATLVMTAGGFALFIPAVRERQEGSALVARQYLDLTVFLVVGLDALLFLWAVLAPTGLLAPDTAVFIAIIALANAVTVFAQRVLQARVSDYEYFAIGALPAIASTLVLVVFVVIVPDVTDYLILYCALSLATMLWALVRLRQRVDLRVIRPYAVVPHLRRAAPTGLSMIGSILVLRGDLTILGLRSTEDQVGQYSMAGSIAGLMFLVAEVFALRAVSAHGAVPTESYAAVVAGLARSAVLAVALSAVPLVGVSWVVLTYLLPDFQPAFWPTVVLAVAAVASAYTRVVAGGMGMVKANRRLYRYAVGSVVLCLLYLPAAAYGALGVAVASLVIYLAQVPIIGGRGALARAAAGSRS
ncbi:MAG: hypothetical protein E6Q90_15235 [Actinobacteria bacterium]|nr:MAG: hypothetical protein E6Q90_15235 [Actinomycetota bacterium]